ncbi:MAG: hypothetical protein WKH68_11920 [Candidatus Limnocylindria bacterium]
MTADDAQRALESADEAFARRDIDAVITHLSSAIRGFSAAAEPCAAALACARLGQVMANFRGNLTASRAWFGRAERLVADLPACLEQGWVAVAAMGCDVDDPDVLLQRAELALDRARQFGDLNLETKALADGGLAHVEAGRIDQGMAMLDEAMALACGPADDTDAAARSVCSFLTACYFAMDFERASNWADLLRQHGLVGPTPGGPMFLSSHCDSVQATLLMELGRWSGAEAMLLRAIADFEATMGPSWHAAIALADLRTRQGRYAEAEALLLGKEQAPQALLPAARLQLDRGDHELAIATARRGLGLLGDDRLRAVELLEVVIEGLLAIADVAGARAAFDDLDQRLGGIGAAFAARCDAARAAVIAAEGDPVAAASVLQVAIDRLDPAVLPWRRAVLLIDLAVMLDRVGDAAAAREATLVACASLAALDVVAPPSMAAQLSWSTRHSNLGAASNAVLAPGARWWTASFKEASVRLPATKGLSYVATLVAAPGTERHVLDLVDRLEGLGGAGDPDRRSIGDAGPLLDSGARTAYRRRIEALRGDIDEALATHAFDHAEALQEELDLLVSQLASAFGIGGSARVAASASERARLNVTRAIRAAAKRLDEALPGAGAALDRRIRTGLYCVYTPEPGEQIHWIVQT